MDVQPDPLPTGHAGQLGIPDNVDEENVREFKFGLRGSHGRTRMRRSESIRRPASDWLVSSRLSSARAQ